MGSPLPVFLPGMNVCKKLEDVHTMDALKLISESSIKKEPPVFNIGDTVRIMETRPLSKNKNWRLVEIIERAK